MATLVTRSVIASGGGDYTTLAAAFTALAKNYVTAEEALRLEVTGNVGDATFNTSWVTTAANYVEIIRVGGNSGLYAHEDINSASISSLTTVNGIGQGSVIIDGLIFRGGSATTGVQDSTASNSGGNFIVKNCFLYTSSSSAILCSKIYKSINNIFAGTFSRAITFRSNRGGIALCNTIVGTGIGIVGSLTTHVVKNNVTKCTDGFSGTFSADSDYNCSDINGDAPGAHSITGTVQFKDAANRDYHLAAADTVARGAGVNLTSSGITTDIDGDARPATGAWDIGADQYVAPASTGPWGTPKFGISQPFGAAKFGVTPWM